MDLSTNVYYFIFLGWKWNFHNYKKVWLGLRHCIARRHRLASCEGRKYIKEVVNIYYNCVHGLIATTDIICSKSTKYLVVQHIWPSFRVSHYYKVPGGKVIYTYYGVVFLKFWSHFGAIELYSLKKRVSYSHLRKLLQFTHCGLNT